MQLLELNDPLSLSLFACLQNRFENNLYEMSILNDIFIALTDDTVNTFTKLHNLLCHSRKLGIGIDLKAETIRRVKEEKGCLSVYKAAIFSNLCTKVVDYYNNAEVTEFIKLY